jgi:hypothetical protein
MIKMQWRKVCVAGCVAAFVGCASSSKDDDANTNNSNNPQNEGGDSSSTTDSDAIKIAMSGAAFPHLLSTAFAENRTTDFTQMAVAIADPQRILQQIDEPLASKVLVTDTQCPSAGAFEHACGFQFDAVDIADVTLGLIAVVDDLPGQADRWVNTGTGIASGSTVAALQESGAALTDIKTFGVSRRAEGVLASLLGKQAGDLEKMGFLIGQVLSNSRTPVGGAVVVPDNNTLFDIYYLNDNLMGVNQTNTSAAHGFFVAVPKDPSSNLPKVTRWGAQATGHTWKGPLAGTNKGTAFVLMLVAE